MPESIPEDLPIRLRAMFERDPWINMHEYPLVVRIDNGCLVLEGSVGDIAAIRRAAALADEIVKDRWPIFDRLRRIPKEPLEDLELCHTVVRRLTTEPVFTEYTLRTEMNGEAETIHDAGPGAYEIFIHIHDKLVTLTGSVSSLSHQRLAEALIWWIDGCEALDNQLAVTPAEVDTDNEITDAVRVVLEKDPLVHASQLRVGTAATIVHLDGSVASEAERKLAVLDTWSVRGVSNVLNRVEVHG